MASSLRGRLIRLADRHPGSVRSALLSLLASDATRLEALAQVLRETPLGRRQTVTASPRLIVVGWIVPLSDPYLDREAEREFRHEMRHEHELARKALKPALLPFQDMIEAVGYGDEGMTAVDGWWRLVANINLKR